MMNQFHQANNTIHIFFVVMEFLQASFNPINPNPKEGKHFGTPWPFSFILAMVFALNQRKPSKIREHQSELCTLHKIIKNPTNLYLLPPQPLTY